MRTMVLDISVPRMLLTQVMGRISKTAYFAPTSPLGIVDLPDPPLPAPDWVRVRNRLCGVCGSDLHQLFLDAGLDVAPVALSAHKRIYLGHEMVRMPCWNCSRILPKGRHTFKFIQKWAFGQWKNSK